MTTDLLPGIIKPQSETSFHIIVENKSPNFCQYHETGTHAGRREHVFQRLFKRKEVTDVQQRPYVAVRTLLSVPQFTTWPFKGKVADHWYRSHILW